MNPLLDFALDWVSLTGGLWEEEEPGLYRVVAPRLPGEIRDMSLITSEPEIAREIPGAHLVVPGSPFVQTLLDDATSRGRLARCCLVGLRGGSPSPESAIASAMNFADSRFSVRSATPMEHRYGLFRFMAVFESDDVQNEAVEVCVNLNNGKLARRVPSAADRAPQSGEPEEDLPHAPVIPAAEAYRIALREAESKIGESHRARVADAAARMEDERKKVRRYFRDLLMEIAEDASGTADATRRAALQARRLAVEAQRERQLLQTAARHELRMRLEIVSILVLSQPKTVMDCMLTHKKGWTGSLRIVWDPLLREIEPVDCPSCGRPGRSFEVAKDHIYCPGETCERVIPRRVWNYGTD